MRSFQVAEATDGEDTLTPHMFNAEIADIVGHAHQVDRDNIDKESLTPGLVALDAWGSIEADSLEDTGLETFLDAQDLNQQVLPIPMNSDGDPLFFLHTTGDGELVISFVCHHKITDGVFVNMWYGIVVDGVLIAKSPWMYGLPIGDGDGIAYRTGCVRYACPVSSGTHRVEFVFGVHGSVSEFVSWDSTVEWGACSWVSRELAR